MMLLTRARTAMSRWIASSRRRVAPYRTAGVGFDVAAMRSTLLTVRRNFSEQGRSDDFGCYREFLSRLRDLPDTDIVPLKELMLPGARDRRRLALRYDIDMDPCTALRLARCNARYGLCGSFFLLHTGYYYGVFREGVLCRNPLLAEWVASLIATGCEIGLHTDPLHVYFEHGIDGAEAVRQELAFLRGRGATVEGTVSHNSLPLYGAENFEIFAGRTVWQRSRLERGGVRVRLGSLNEESLGLTYEGNYSSGVSLRPTAAAEAWLRASMTDAVHNESWMRTYLGDTCFRRAYQAVVWHHGGGQWTLSASFPNGLSRWSWKSSLDEACAVLRELPAGTRIVVLLHPVYFSADHGYMVPAREPE